MSTYRDRVGQRIGPIEVLADYKRTARGRVIWKCWHHDLDVEKFYRTDQLISMDRQRLADQDGGGE